jgi:hypothetical protein
MVLAIRIKHALDVAVHQFSNSCVTEHHATPRETVRLRQAFSRASNK